MASNLFPFTIPESLRSKKATNLPSKPTARNPRAHFYSPARRKRYKDLDAPLGQSSSSSLSRPVPIFKRIAASSRASSCRQSLARATRFARRLSSSTSRRSQDLRSKAFKSSTFDGETAQMEKRLKASRSGTVHSGVDNRVRIVRKEGKVRHWSPRELVNKGENVTKVERQIEATKVESVTERLVLPKGAVARQLKRMIGRLCETDIEKYQILEERDKLMHRGRLKTTDVENATAMQGTCPDMCPEKERYMRVIQKRLSSYECREDGRMAPELAVKEYSRSAADQEEPLPHELRPADVLRRTMNYLVGEIANRVPDADEELAQWYDFLWNRTRAIRKDITQQMMVSDTAVSLIEQCVRLHIFAAHRLCELNFNEFDQKMNTENLSKSLQSLRHLYEDLSKKGIFYSSEAEFRAYEIMLNLSDSNVFRQALTYRREILEAMPVRLAIHLFTALQSQNYVRFFRLIKNDATYLQCCLCHRYFNHMRHQAMYALSHSVHITGKYPVSKFVQLLGFDDYDAALQFLECYNVRRINDLDTGEELMLMSKTRLIEPIEDPPSRIHSWIEMKRRGYTVTEVLSGGTNVEVVISTPLNSFDKHGAYVFDAVIDDYINATGIEAVSANENEFINYTFTLPTQLRDAEHETVDALAEKLATEIMNEQVTRLCKLTYGKSLLHSLTTGLFDQIFEDSLRSCCQEVMMAAKLQHRHKLAADAAKDDIRSLTDSMSYSVLMEIIDKNVQEAAQKYMKKCLKVYNDYLLDSVAKNVLDDLVDEVIDENVKKIGESKIEEGANFMKQRLREINERLDKLWLKQFVDHWREKIAHRKEEERKKMEFLGTFPVILPARNGLVFPGYSESQLKGGFIDVSSLMFEKKLNAFTEKRRERIARKMFAKWKMWTQLQIEKREFFTITDDCCSTLKFRRRHDNNRKINGKSEDVMRFHLALLEVECERVKPFWTNWEILEEIEKQKPHMSWRESLAERSSTLLDYVDGEALERGLDIARRNLERVNPRRVGIANWKNENWVSNNLLYRSEQHSLSKSFTADKEVKERVENSGPPTKKKKKSQSLERIAERLEKLTKELDDALHGLDEKNRRYDEILSTLKHDN